MVTRFLAWVWLGGWLCRAWLFFFLFESTEEHAGNGPDRNAGAALVVNGCPELLELEYPSSHPVGEELELVGLFFRDFRHASGGDGVFAVDISYVG